MDVVGLAVGLISLIGIVPVIYGWYLYIGKLIPTKRFLAFDETSMLDIIVTTSSISESATGAKIIRATTGIGQVQGTSYVSRFLGKSFRKKEIDVFMSKAVYSRPINDLILLGGPAKNEYSARFIEKLSSEFPELELLVDDINATIKLKNKSYSLDPLDIQSGLPKKDFGLVVLWKNPFASGNRRAVYCSGLTSYGTSGSAVWFFEDILTSHNQKTSSLFSAVGKKSPSFLAVLEIDIVNGGIASIEELEIIPLKAK